MEPKEMSPEMTQKVSQLTAMIAEVMLMAYQEGLDHGIKTMQDALESRFTSPKQTKDE